MAAFDGDERTGREDVRARGDVAARLLGFLLLQHGDGREHVELRGDAEAQRTLERGPEDVRVRVDETRQQRLARPVDHLRARGDFRVRAGGDDDAVLEDNGGAGDDARAVEKAHVADRDRGLLRNARDGEGEREEHADEHGDRMGPEWCGEHCASSVRGSDVCQFGVRQPRLPLLYATERGSNIRKRQLRLPHSKRYTRGGLS